MESHIDQGPDEHLGRPCETAANGHRHGGQIGRLRNAARPGFPHADGAAAGRTRILAAATEVVAERGYARATVQAIVARADVSREVFHRLFSNRQECFLGAFDRAVERCAEQIDATFKALDATPQAEDWSERMRSVLTSLLRLAERQPGMARLLLVESRAAGPLVTARREELLRRVAAGIEAGETGDGQFPADAVSASGGGPPAWPAAESLLAAAAALVWARLHSGERPLTALTNALMAMLVLPRRGPAGAAREMAGASS